MTNEDMPPWDINRIPTNPIDQTHIYIPQQDIFSFNKQEAWTQTTPPHKNIQTLPTQNPVASTQNQSPQIHQNTQNTQTGAHPTQQVQEPSQSVPLALKYRPKTFAELIGQESVARTLCLALESKKIANAYLFSGLRGSGKTSSARILARSLQCESGITPSPCGSCPNCVAALKSAHLDIIELDGASNRKIDDIRELIEQTHYKPTMGRFKVFIIDEVHMLTKEAFNSLLKTLEEPPNYVKFILATTDPLKVPPTILSRAQHFRFKKIPTNTLRNHLAHILQKEGVQADKESLDMIIRNGHGSVRDTLTLLDQAIVFCQNKLNTQKLADMLGSLDPKAFDSLFQALLRKNMQECVQFAHSLDGYDIDMILDELSLYIKNKMLEEIPQIPPILGMRYANIINDSKAMLQLDCDGEFCLLLTILKMLEAQKIREVSHAIKQLETQIATESTQITQLANTYLQTHNTDSIHTESMPQKAQDSMAQDSMQSDLTQEDSIQHNSMQSAQNTHEATVPNKQYTAQAIQPPATESPTTKLSAEQASLPPHNIAQSQSERKSNGETKIAIIENNTNASAKNTTTRNTQAPIQTQTASHETQAQKIQPQETQSQAVQIQHAQKKEDSQFRACIEKIFARDYNVGMLFEQKIAFERLENQNLYLTFYTTAEETELLRKGYSGIMQVLREVYGDSIQMKVEKKPPQDLEKKELHKRHSAQKEESTQSLNISMPATQPQQNEIQKESEAQNTQSTNTQPLATNYITVPPQETYPQTANQSPYNARENMQQKEVQSPQADIIHTHNTQQGMQDSQTTAPQPNDNDMNATQQFMAQNSAVIKSMKNELGVKDIKIIPLDTF